MKIHTITTIVCLALAGACSQPAMPGPEDTGVPTETDGDDAGGTTGSPADVAQAPDPQLAAETECFWTCHAACMGNEAAGELICGYLADVQGQEDLPAGGFERCRYVHCSDVCHSGVEAVACD